MDANKQTSRFQSISDCTQVDFLHGSQEEVTVNEQISESKKVRRPHETVKRYYQESDTISKQSLELELEPQSNDEVTLIFGHCKWPYICYIILLLTSLSIDFHTHINSIKSRKQTHLVMRKVFHNTTLHLKK